LPIRDTKDIGRAVRATRRAQGLTQTELAGACGTSIRFIVELEKGKPTSQIARVLHVLGLLGIELRLDGVQGVDGASAETSSVDAGPMAGSA
jgi:HTH-type transcriptional regulator/antitoxin HipB